MKTTPEKGFLCRIKGFSLAGLDDFPDDILNEADKLPLHSTCKERTYRYNRRDRFTYAYTLTDRLYEHYVDKPFDEAFSYFCSKVEVACQHIFLSIAGIYSTSYFTRYTKYYVDEDGIIRKVISDKVKLKVAVKSKDYKEEEVCDIYRHGVLWKTVPFTERLWMRFFSSEFEVGKKYTRIKEGKIEYFDGNDYRVKRQSMEERKDRKKSNRENKRARKDFEYSFLTKKERKIKENFSSINNDIKIVSHGFDLVTSFRN
jgi:hypothetical protein